MNVCQRKCSLVGPSVARYSACVCMSWWSDHMTCLCGRNWSMCTFKVGSALSFMCMGSDGAVKVRAQDSSAGKAGWENPEAGTAVPKTLTFGQRPRSSSAFRYRKGVVLDGRYTIIDVLGTGTSAVSTPGSPLLHGSLPEPLKDPALFSRSQTLQF
jgi:hypothetical protein